MELLTQVTIVTQFQKLHSMRFTKIINITIILEGTKPRLTLEERVAIRENIARMAHIAVSEVGLSVITGEGLCDCGCGLGMHCQLSVTTSTHL